jgi:hypothetical protein
VFICVFQLASGRKKKQFVASQIREKAMKTQRFHPSSASIARLAQW